MTPSGVLGKEQRKADFFPVQGLPGGKVPETTQTGVLRWCSTMGWVID